MNNSPQQYPYVWNRRRFLSTITIGAAAAVAGRAGWTTWRDIRTAQDYIEPAIPSGPSTSSALGPTPELEVVQGPSGSVLVPVLDGETDSPEPGHLFDLVIRNGRVVDPASGFDGLVDVGIDGSRITALSPVALTGREMIEASGLVVAPGFVDILSYEPNSFGAWLKIADGVTTNLAMHGVSSGAEFFFNEYEGVSPVHFGGAFNHHFMRSYNVGLRIDEGADNRELDRLMELARTGLENGFAGIAFSPEYSPGTTNTEMDRLLEVAADYGHIGFFHLRHSDPDPPGTSLEALAEVMSIAERHRAGVHVQHLTSTGGTFVMPDAIRLIEQARNFGIDITACVYPYDFWGTFLASNRFAKGWQERYRIDYDDLQIAGTDERLTAETFASARAENKLAAALGSIPEDEVQMALRQPWVMIGSDAIPTPGLNNHPRGAGTFARTLGRYVRDLGVLDLRTGLAKMTIQPALRVEAMIPAMKRKARLQRGADADIVVFDPNTVADRATVAEPGLASVGIDWVLVEGRIALREGRAQIDVLAGRALKAAVS